MTTPADPAVDAVWCGICCCWVKVARIEREQAIEVRILTAGGPKLVSCPVHGLACEEAFVSPCDGLSVHRDCPLSRAAAVILSLVGAGS